MSTEREIAEKIIADAEKMATEGKAKLAELDKPKPKFGEKVIFKCSGRPRVLLYNEEGKLMILIIPKPTKAIQLAGSFTLNQNNVIVVQDTELKQNAAFLANWG